MPPTVYAPTLSGGDRSRASDSTGANDRSSCGGVWLRSHRRAGSRFTSGPPSTASIIPGRSSVPRQQHDAKGSLSAETADTDDHDVAVPRSLTSVGYCHRQMDLRPRSCRTTLRGSQGQAETAVAGGTDQRSAENAATPHGSIARSAPLGLAAPLPPRDPCTRRCFRTRRQGGGSQGTPPS
jgi:hypothetical protein